MRNLLLLACCLSVAIAQPPKTKIQPVTDTLHGIAITDPYRWLEDQNSPETRAWIEEQMAYTESVLRKLPQRERIQRRLGELMKIDTMGAPTVRNGRYFFSKRRADQNQSVVYVRQGLDGPETLLIDPNPMNGDHTISVQLMGVSRDGRILAYGLRQGGEDETTLALLDVETRKDLPEHFPRARYEDFTLKPDRSGFYYVKHLPEGPRAYYHALGSEIAGDKVVFGGQARAEQFIGSSISLDGRWLVWELVTGSSGDKVEVFVQDLPSGKPATPVITGLDARFEIQIADDRLYVMTNWRAPNSRVLTIDLKNPAQANWKEIVPERKSVLQGITVAGGKLVASWLENVHTHIEILAEDGKLVRELKLPSLGVAAGPFGRWDSDEAFYAFSSFGRPSTIYRYSMASGRQSLWFQAKLPFDPDSVEVKQVWYESRDKTRIPMFVAHKKGLKLDGSHPALLTGYGGFNVSSLPISNAIALAWIDMGGVYALANLRGGGEFGEEWHKAGMFGNKQNVFDDFIAAAVYLIREKYTAKSRLAIRGGSNGGLLVGAALTQRPDLFQAVVCGAPLLDMVRYDQFKVAKFWVSEYGTAQDPEQFPYIYKYSPYHHVEKGVKYPAVMFVTGDADTRVDPLHARKMAALLETSTASERPVLLHYDTKAGHSGGLPIDRQIENNADELAFLAWQTGISQ